MTDVLIINHGTTSQHTPWDKNLLSDIGKKYSVSFKPELQLYGYSSVVYPVLVYPGFGTTQFNAKKNFNQEKNQGYSKTYRLKVGSKEVSGDDINKIRQIIQAKDWIDAAASWLWDDLDIISNGNRHNINNLLFIGWSRGAVLTWYQIFDLVYNRGFEVNFQALAIDPSYGPAYTRSAANRAQEKANRIWEISMMYQMGGTNPKGLAEDSLMTPYPSTKPDLRVFLPGKHGSAVKEDGYGNIKLLGAGVVGGFLASSECGFPQYFQQPTTREIREVYAKCKNSLHPFLNFSHCTRFYVKDKYNTYKNNKPWAKAGYFFNQQDYDSLSSGCPNIVKALCHLPYDIGLLRTEYNTIKRSESELAQSLYRWAKHNHLNPNHGFAFKLHGVRISAAKEFIRNTGWK